MRANFKMQILCGKYTYNGSSKKKCQLSWSFVFCWTLLLFYSNMVHKQWLKVWFLTSQMPVLSGRINFVSFSTTWIFCFPKIPMKYSKNGQKFAMSKNTSNMLFKTCWTLCKKPHLSTWSRSRYTFFWMTRYLRKFMKGFVDTSIDRFAWTGKKPHVSRCSNICPTIIVANHVDSI